MFCFFISPKRTDILVGHVFYKKHMISGGCKPASFTVSHVRDSSNNEKQWFVECTLLELGFAQNKESLSDEEIVFF